MGTLTSLANKYRTDKGTTHSRGALGPQGYTEFYEPLLEPFRLRPIRFLEIGVAQGASLRMWRDWFPFADIFGLDSAPEQVPGCTVVQGEQQDSKLLVALGAFDLVLDDASHEFAKTVASFEGLFPSMPIGGLYIVEDLHAPFDHGHTREFFRNHYDATLECDERIAVIRRL